MKNICRKLRNTQTEAERLLWSRLRDRRFLGLKFRRQHPIANCVADFCSPEAKLILEIDGGQHSENRVKDQQRTDRLELYGYRVLRFWNHEVLESVDAVMEKIQMTLSAPHPTPLPNGEREKMTCAFSFRRKRVMVRTPSPFQGEGRGEGGLLA